MCNIGRSNNIIQGNKIILAIHSDAGYCNKIKSQSWVGGHFFLSNDDDHPPNNGAILTAATIIKAVITLAAKAELGAIYLNAKEVVYLCQILTKVGHLQPRTRIQTNNSTVQGVINLKIQPKQTKAMDMCFHCLSRTQKSSNQNLLHQVTSTRTGFTLVLHVPIDFYCNFCNNIY